MSSERVLEKIKAQILELVPDSAAITQIEFEGPEVGIYSKNIKVLVDNGGLISKIARTIRKRVVIRSDPSIRQPKDIVKEKIHKIIGDIVEIGSIEFDDSLGEVIIRVDKPAKITSRDTNYLDEIIIQTKWRPNIYRIPPLQSTVIKSVRNVLSTDADARTKALRNIGKIVHREPLLKEPIVRITALGGYKEVGRSSTLLQTGDANVLIDCGVSVGSAEASKMLPRFDLPEFELTDLDAVVVSHAHLDHCLPYNTPVRMADDSIKYIGDIKKDESVLSMNWNTGKLEPKRVTSVTETRNHEGIYHIFTTYQNIISSPNHRFFTYKNLKLKEMEAQELTEGILLPLYESDENQKNRQIALNTDLKYNGKIKLNQITKTKFKKFRKSQNLTQKKVANELDIQPDTISKLENSGKYVTYQILSKLIDFYNQDVVEFLKQNGMPYIPKIITSELAQIVGYIQGDGTKSSSYSIRITEIDMDVINEYVKLFKQVFNYTPIVRERSDINDVYYIEINSKMIVEFLENNFHSVLAYSRDIEVPDIIETNSDVVVTGYLRGLFDAEGSPIPSVKCTSYSKQLITKVQNLLFRLGIHSAYSPNDHSIFINSPMDMKLYKEKIGFSSVSKTEKLVDYLKNSISTDYNLRNLIPISRNDFQEILKNIGYIGPTHDGPKINELSMSLLDFYRRDDGYISRNTGIDLINLLKSRYEELLDIISQPEGIDVLRKNMSFAQTSLSDNLEISIMQLQYHEKGYHDELTALICEFLSNKLEDVLVYIEETIEKIEHLISLPVEWVRINRINVEKNKEPLYDIGVADNQNFVANSQIIHNCGFVPFLYKYGYEGPVYTTEPTRDLMTMLQIDYLDVAEKEGKLLPYSKSDIRKTMLHTITLGYGEVTDIAPDVRLTLHNAGHILGSSIVHIHVGNGKYNIAFAHDFKFANSRLLDRAHYKFPRLETMVMESTYGNPQDITPSRQQCEGELAELINKAINRGGKVLIPVLAVGRAQELQLIIENLMKNEKIPKVPVYLEGMITEATAITTSHPEFVSRQLRERIFVADDSPFLSDAFHQVNSFEEREEIIHGDPCIIMATSGMLVGGPSVYYFNNLAEDKKNSVIFVSYQGKGTLGRKITEGAREVKTKNEDGKVVAIEINLEVSQISGFTGHSDRRELIEYAKRLSPRPKQFLLVHGEASKCETLAKSIGRTVKRESIAPRIGSTFRLY